MLSASMDWIKRTLHALLNSKPGGAFTLSVCPRRKPVRRLSRSITAPNKRVSDILLTCHVSTRHPPPPGILIYQSCAGISVPGFHLLWLSHASNECLGLLSPFCMCRILERAAPEKPNICRRHGPRSVTMSMVVGLHGLHGLHDGGGYLDVRRA